MYRTFSVRRKDTKKRKRKRIRKNNRNYQPKPKTNGEIYVGL